MIKLVMIALGFLWPYLVKLFWFLLAAVGIGAVSYTGTMTGINYLLLHIHSGTASMSGTIGQIAHAYGADAIISGIVAGTLTRVAINGIGTLKKLALRGS